MYGWMSVSVRSKFALQSKHGVCCVYPAPILITSVGHKQELPLHALTWTGMQLFSAYLFDLVDLDFRHCERLVYAAWYVDGFGVVVRA